MASTGGASRVRVVVVGWDGGGSFGCSLGLAAAQLNFRCGRSAGFQPFAIHHRAALSRGAHLARPRDSNLCCCDHVSTLGSCLTAILYPHRKLPKGLGSFPRPNFERKTLTPAGICWEVAQCHFPAPSGK